MKWFWRLLSTRPMLFILPRLLIFVIRVDGFTVDQYQRFIADPLQLRGVSLMNQRRALYALAAIGALFAMPLSYINIPLFLMWAVNAYVVSGPPDAEPGETLTRNPYRYYFIFVAGRIFLLLVTLLMFTAHLWYYIFVYLTCLADACDSKPPRPRRLKVLVPQEGM